MKNAAVLSRIAYEASVRNSTDAKHLAAEAAAAFEAER